MKGIFSVLVENKAGVLSKPPDYLPEEVLTSTVLL